MSLRIRLLLTIGVSFTLFWGLSSLWMLVDLRREFRSALDERLEASARMVAVLVADYPKLTNPAPVLRSLPLARHESVVCEIRLLQGEIVGRTANSPQRLGLAPVGFSTLTVDGVAWRRYTMEQHGLRVTTADRLDRREQLLHGIALASFIPFAIAIVASLLALWFGIRRGLLPLESIQHALASRAPDALQPLPEKGLPAELVPLVGTVNALLWQIERAMKRERRFTADAAHELRTPLTAVKTHIQVARMAGGGSHTETALEHAEEGVRRLHSTIDQLLTLARVEGPFSFDGDEQIDAGAALEGALSQLPNHGTARVKILDEGGACMRLLIPASLTLIALRNVLDNAVRHASHQTSVVARISRTDGAVLFVIENEGDKISEADASQAAQRFWRKGRGLGSGLGLSIVDAIVTRYSGTWGLYPRSGGGVVVRLSLPASLPRVTPLPIALRDQNGAETHQLE